MNTILHISFSSKRRPKSQNGGRTIFNFIIRFDIKYKETTLALCLASVQNKQKIYCNDLEINRKLTFSLPPYPDPALTRNAASKEWNDWKLIVVLSITYLSVGVSPPIVRLCMTHMRKVVVIHRGE